jgi:hypothetical protein
MVRRARKSSLNPGNINGWKQRWAGGENLKSGVRGGLPNWATTDLIRTPHTDKQHSCYAYINYFYICRIEDRIKTIKIYLVLLLQLFLNLAKLQARCNY